MMSNNIEGNNDSQTESKSKRFKVDNMNPNPFLLDLVLENVFPYCSTSVDSLRNLRLVCKTWDREIRKNLRRKTETDLTYIISAYPLGFGWKESSDKLRYYYKAPYEVAPFANIKIRATCNAVTNVKAIRWFQRMGDCVKKLSFHSSLMCYHQTRFLECVLKNWCKNLRSLSLCGVTCYTNLNHFSRFVDRSGFICDLKEIVVSGSSESFAAVDCTDFLYEIFLSSPDNLKNRSTEEERNAKTNSVENQESESKVSPSFNLGAQLASTLMTDGGVLGQIFRGSEIESIIVKDYLLEHTDAFIMSMNRRLNKIIKTLKHFEYDNFAMFMWGWQMDRFQKFKFPISTLRLGALTTRLSNEDVNRLLLSFKDTLEHLEFSGTIVFSDWEDDSEDEDEEYILIKIPVLPKVKTFTNRNIFCTRLGGLDFVTKLPSLEKLSLTNAIYHSSIYPLNPSQVFNMLFQSAIFQRQNTHPLVELHLEGKISYTRHIQLLVEWFPQLKKAELVLEGSDVLVEFFRLMKGTVLQDAKLSFYSTDHDWCNTTFINCVPEMKHLQFLELVHLSDNPMALTLKAFEEGFARAPRLTSLKFENFSVFVDETDGIRQSVSHISCVQFVKCTPQYKPIDAEFSVGCVKPFTS